jgi:phosphoribosyl-AMP cyclohydrolase
LKVLDMHIDFEKAGGLVPAIAQDAASGAVLMMAWMNREAFDETLRTGRAVYFSRSRGKLWRKGEESGNVQLIKEVYLDCDGDTLLLKVEQVGGAACHEGYQCCFFRRLAPTGEVAEIVGKRLFDPAQVYSKPKA